MDRGTYEQSFDTVNEVSAVRWNDNAVVTVLSNHLKQEPMHRAKRFDRKKMKMGTIEMPHPIHEYNRTMGGVDLFDNATNNYRIRIRGKKWYWPLITNAAMVNAWKLHCFCRRYEKNTIMSQLDFRVFVAECMLQTSMPMKDSQTQGARNSDVVRLDGKDHIIEKNEKRIRCRQCKSQTWHKCSKCNIGLHAKCFTEYHKNEKK